MIQEDDKVEYIYYMNDNKEKEYWGISPITNIAHKLFPPTKPRQVKGIVHDEYMRQLNHFNMCTEKATNGKVKYITEYLIKQGFCNFERDGDIYHFAKYLDESPYVSMLTRECDICGEQVLLSVEETTCKNCFDRGSP